MENLENKEIELIESVEQTEQVENAEQLENVEVKESDELIESETLIEEIAESKKIQKTVVEELAISRKAIQSLTEDLQKEISENEELLNTIHGMSGSIQRLEDENQNLNAEILKLKSITELKQYKQVVMGEDTPIEASFGEEKTLTEQYAELKGSEKDEFFKKHKKALFAEGFSK